MDQVISLSIDLQMVIVAGYLGYKITVIGRGVSHGTEELLAQVLAYGLLARGGAFALGLGADAILHWLATTNPLPAAVQTLVVGVVTTSLGLLAGVLWRRDGNRIAAAVLNAIGTHTDDHQATTWASVLATKAEWQFVQVHLKDGRILESVFELVSKAVPGHRLILSDDGISCYVTKIHRADGTTIDVQVNGNDNDYVATYIPRDNVTQVDFGWR